MAATPSIWSLNVSSVSESAPVLAIKLLPLSARPIGNAVDSSNLADVIASSASDTPSVIVLTVVLLRFTVLPALSTLPQLIPTLPELLILWELKFVGALAARKELSVPRMNSF